MKTRLSLLAVVLALAAPLARAVSFPAADALTVTTNSLGSLLAGFGIPSGKTVSNSGTINGTGLFDFSNGTITLSATEANYILGTSTSLSGNYQPLDSDLTAIAALTTTAAGRNFLLSTGTLSMTSGKTLSVLNTLTLSGTDGSTLAIGTGGTLGTNAFLSTAFLPLAGGGTITGSTTFNALFTGSGSIALTGSVSANTGSFSALNMNLWAINTVGQNGYFVGASILYGSGLGTASLSNGGLTGNFAQLFGNSVLESGKMTIFNDGVPAITTLTVSQHYTTGDTVAGVVVPSAHSQSPAVTGKPGYIFVFGDAAFNSANLASESYSGIVADLNAIYTSAHADSYSVVMMTSPIVSTTSATVTATVSQVNDAIRSGSVSSDMVIDSARWLQNQFNTQLFQSDKTHPTAAGQIAMAANLVSAMTSHGSPVEFSGRYVAEPITLAGGINGATLTTAGTLIVNSAAGFASIPASYSAVFGGFYVSGTSDQLYNIMELGMNQTQFQYATYWAIRRDTSGATHGVLGINEAGTLNPAFDFTNTAIYTSRQTIIGTTVSTSSVSVGTLSNSPLLVLGNYTSGSVDQIYGRVFVTINTANGTGYGAYLGSRRDASGNTHTAVGVRDGDTDASIIDLQFSNRTLLVTGSLSASSASFTVGTFSGLLTGATASFTTTTFTAAITTTGGAVLLKTSTALTDGAAAGVGTLTNAPASTNPTKWIGVNDNGTVRYVPSW